MTGLSASMVSGQTPVPVFEDLLTDTSHITGQWTSQYNPTGGIFSGDGYTLTQSTRFGGVDQQGSPRSEDYVWYTLPGVCADASCSVELDVKGLYPNAGVQENELMNICDATGLNPNTTSNDFYLCPYEIMLKKENETEVHVNTMKLAVASTTENRRTNALTWDGATTYRIRVTWNGTLMRWYWGFPGQTLTLLQPPTPYTLTTTLPIALFNMQIGSTFRAGPRNIPYAGGTPGTVYSLVRIYEDDIGGVATPPRGWETTVSINMGTTDVVDGLSRVVFSDGDTTPATIGGRDARRNQDPGDDYYIYFNVNDLFAYQADKPDVYVMIDYYDTGSGPLTLQYDATGSGNAYKSGGSVALTGTNTWKQYYYHVTDAYLGNRQNGGADLRIFGGAGNVFYLDIVAVSVNSPLPPKASSPSPAHQATGVSRDADLSWAPGEGATSYDVCFGRTSPPAFQGNQAQTSFEPGMLDPLTTCFWRIDTVNGFGTTAGDIWRFTTKSFAGDLDGDLDVDQEDFGYFQACFSGTGVDLTPGCESADLHVDGDVDQEDFAVFQNCMAGPNRPPGCQ